MTPTRLAWISIAAAVATMGLKVVAWWLTGSVGLLSDALESSVNLVAAVLLLVTVLFAARPPDATHEYGHEKAELFSAGGEGIMIIAAAAFIVASSVERLVNPSQPDHVAIGLLVSAAAAVVNLVVGLVLLREGRTSGSMALQADGQHLLTDVWTSAGVVVGVALVGITGWERLDPIVGLAVGVNIIITGWRLVGRAGHGLMDPPFPPEERQAVDDVLRRFAGDHVTYHAVRTRTAGQRRFIELHVLVPGSWSVQQGHTLLEEMEAALREVVPHLTVTAHLEPIEDPVSYEDQELDRFEPGA